MTVLPGALFTSPIALTGFQHALLLVPLCLAVAVVYKTVRCEKIREIPPASALLCVTIIAGMYAVGVGMWLAYLAFA